ncbi:MAG: M20 metallopeptidase family protein [Eubacterium sp.]|jgi:amidohydrolase
MSDKIKIRALPDAIEEEIRKNKEENIENRRHIHMHPETGFDTQETEKFVKSRLEALGIEIIPTTVGVVGIIRGPKDGPTIALRADMDALNLTEDTGVPYASQIPGKMHACGHDAHTAILLGTSKILQEHRDLLKGDVIVIFQPAEEGPNLGGARIILKDFNEKGITEKIRYMFGLHVSNDAPTGVVRHKYGSTMASTDEIEITVHGKGGHPGRPHQTIDALSVTAKIVTAVEAFVSRRIDPFDQVVVSFGIMKAGTAKNIVAEEGILQGTIRCQNETTRAMVLEKLENITKHVCAAYDATCDVKIIHGLPVLRNDPEAAKYAEDVVREALPQYSIDEMDKGSMGAEDFSYFAQAMKTCFMFIGSANPDKGATYPGHNPRFNIDEDVIDIGIRIECALVLNADTI